VISLAPCGSRAKRRARQFFQFLDFCAASLSVLLVTLIGRVLFDIALPALFSEVFSGTRLGVLRAHLIF